MRPETTDSSMGSREESPRSEPALSTVEEWKQAIAPYQVPLTWRASLQIVDTLGPIVLLWYLISLALPVSRWLALPLAVLVGAILVRVFIIFHHCGHGSFFRSRLANDVTGFVAGVLTFTPYYQWRWEHARHHATSGHLDWRGTGDVWTITVQEHLESSRWKRFAYRLARDPFVHFVLAPLYVFVLRQRIPSSRDLAAGPEGKRKGRQAGDVSPCPDRGPCCA
jgi:omega-6 fatty acid desaturase (delta-12 desaturase)